MADLPFDSPLSSAIPGALAAVMANLPGVLPADTTVWFGAELPAYAAPLTLWISDIVGDQTTASLGPDYRREEEFDLVCSLIAYQGGVPDFSPTLTALMANFALITVAIANNPQLWGTVRFAECKNFHVTPETDANGMSAITLDFNIHCQARVKTLGSSN